MAGIKTLQKVVDMRILKNSPYADIIIPLIEYFNAPHQRARNPYSALAAASLLAGRAWNWGNGPHYVLDFKKCRCGEACRGCDPSITYVKIDEPCPPCPGDEVGEGHTGASGILTDEIIIKGGAGDDGLADPYTPEIRTFEQLLGGISMNQPNDRVYFEQIVDAFYQNVDFVDYFVKADKWDLYSDMVGGSFQEGYRPSGIDVSTDTEAVSAFANTVIYTGASQFADDTGTSPYFTLDAFGVALPYQFYFTQNDFDTAAIIPGGTFADIQIAITGTETAAQMRDLIYAAIDGTSAFTVTTDGNNVIATATGPGTTTGIFNYTNLLMFPDVSKLYDFTADVGGQKINVIDYSDAVAASLEGTYFKMFDAANDGYLFYYETPANPVDPDSLGVAYTTAVAINISANGSGGCYQAAGGVSFVCPPKSRCVNGECIYDISGIQDITTAAIIGTGAFTLSGVWDGGTYCGGYAAVAEGNWADAEGGTANIGGTNQLSTVAASDGTVFATDVYNDFEFAQIYNANVPAYERKKFNKEVHYLKPVATVTGSGGIWNCNAPCSPTPPNVCATNDTGTRCKCTGPCSSSNLMMQTTYMSVTADMPFNTSGVSSWSGQGKHCPTCKY